MAATETNGVPPNPSHLTLRFKNGKTTVLLFVTPTDDFEDIKDDLLRALASSGFESVNGAQIPTDPADIELAIPVNRNDISKGWTALQDAAEAGSSKKAKLSDRTPLAADLKDNSVLAFRFRGGHIEDKWDVQMAMLEEIEPEEAEEDMDQS